MSETPLPGEIVEADETEPDQGHPRKWLILATVSSGLVLGILNVSLVNIAIPALIEEFGTTVSGASWVVNAFNITQAVLLLSFGRLADRYGQRRVYLTALSIFSLASLACGLAGSVDQLIAFRVLQAVGSAGIVPISLIILLSVFPRHQHGLATGLWGAFGNAAAIIGPPVGGALITYGSWHWIFFMSLLVGIVAAILAFLFVPEMRREAAGSSLDGGGIGLSAAALFCLTLGIIQGNSWGWRSAQVLGLLAAAVVFLVAFLLWQNRARSPMLNLSLFRIRPFSAANAMGVVGGIGMAGSTLLIVLFMINVLGYSELQAALTMIPASIVAMILSPFAGRLIDRLGPRYLGAVGTIFFAVAFFLFSQLRSDSSFWDVIWRQLFIGVALSVHMPAITAAGLTSLPLRASGVGSGMISTARQFGNILGIALLLAIYGHAALAGTEATVVRATEYVVTRQDLSAEVKEEATRVIERNAEEGGAAAAASGSFFDPAAGLSDAFGGRVSAEVTDSLDADLTAIAQSEMGRSYMWPFLVAAMFAVFGLPLAFLLGRRLGEAREPEAEESRA
ncbi:MAG: DHA2 family efflux MFS transporter permease subunit [Actinobacteria bacterium]|nr:DHA2 family efflux MFS transporter permease subunit [Actinomycetota bacterium]